MTTVIRGLSLAAAAILLGQAAAGQVVDLTPRGGTAEVVAASPTSSAIVLAGISNEAVHRSSDGGATFSDEIAAFGEDVDLVGFDSAGRAFAASNATLWSSSDTGVTWLGTPLPWTGVSQIHVSSAAADELWAVVNDGAFSLWRSFDGGAQWASAPTPTGTSGRLSLDRFRADTAVFFNAGQFYWSIDGGTSWTMTAPPVTTFDRVAFTDGVAIAGGGAFGTGLWTSADLGATWTEVRSGAVASMLVADPFVGGRAYCQLDADGFLVSSDSGATWQAKPESAGLNARSATTIAGSPESLRLGTGNYGVLRSEASGALQLGGGGLVPLRVFGVTVAPGDRDHFAARVPSSNIAETSDGGVTWRAVAMPTVDILVDIEFDVLGRLYASGREGTNPILLRRDATGWTEMQLGAAANGVFEIGDVVASEENPDLIIAAGLINSSLGRAKILVSQDGGSSWAANSLTIGRSVRDLGILEGTASPRIVMVTRTTLQGGSPFSEVLWSDDFGQSTVRHQAALNAVFSLAHSRSVARRVVVGRRQPGPMAVSDSGLSSFMTVGPGVQTDSLVVGSVDPDLLIRSEASPTLRALFLSRDAGMNWSQLWTTPVSFVSGGIPELTMRSDDSEVLVAGSPGLLSIRLDGLVGKPECGPAVTHSGSRDARVTGHGSDSIAINGLRLHAHQLPHNAFGFFLASRTTGFTANPGGSFGNLCLAGAIGRDYGSLASSGALGEINYAVDVSSLPAPMGPVSAIAGEAWTYQLWFRDTVAGQAGSNFTDALTLTWTQ